MMKVRIEPATRPGPRERPHHTDRGALDDWCNALEEQKKVEAYHKAISALVTDLLAKCPLLRTATRGDIRFVAEALCDRFHIIPK